MSLFQNSLARAVHDASRWVCMQLHGVMEQCTVMHKAGACSAIISLCTVTVVGGGLLEAELVKSSQGSLPKVIME
jgi:hypothetical protein